jgi:hypothetical protein
MTLREVTQEFLESARQKDFPRNASLDSLARSLDTLLIYFSPDIAPQEITPAALRDFLSRWYVEESGSPPKADAKAAHPGHAASHIAPEALCVSLEDFFKWAQAGEKIGNANEHLLIIETARRDLPRVFEITRRLTQRLAETGGAFAFPEFLTSFEEGGRSQYDLDSPGEVGAIEGYFRISRIDGARVEAQEVISDEMVWPIIFPVDVVTLLFLDCIINLELTLKSDGWRIASCGFAYPPGTEI